MSNPEVLAILILIVAAICYYDFGWRRIPDWLNLLLFAIGISMQGINSWHDAAIVTVAAACVSLMLWFVCCLHNKITGRVGLGLGDVKLAGASAVWFSPWNLPVYLFAASLSALIYFAVRYGFNRSDATTIRVPFGPFLGIALIATWGLEHMNYLNLAPQLERRHVHTENILLGL